MGRNIENEKDFVIHHVTKEIFPQVYDSSAEIPSHNDEFDVVGLTAIPSLMVKSPRVKESPIHFECQLYNSMEIGDGLLEGAIDDIWVMSFYIGFIVHIVNTIKAMLEMT